MVHEGENSKIHDKETKLGTWLKIAMIEFD